MTHEPVMLNEVLDHLPLAPGAVYADGTLGLAGHAIQACQAISPGGMIVATDWDEQMLKEAKEKLSQIKDVEIQLFHSDYRDLPTCLASACAEAGRVPFADAILLDLGLNNAQIEDEARGISFRSSGPLDMRMDRSSGEPASSFLNRATASELEQVLWDFGDERWARKIAQVIVERRKKTPLRTTDELVDCVMASIPAAKRDKRIHPATRTFQAIRIFVNRELDDLEDCVKEIARCLAPNGVMVVLSYHSGEDRCVKHAFRSLAKEENFELVTKKPLRPTEDEVTRNPKSRSAVMRVLQRPNKLKDEQR